jgi:hypothetical protein
VHGKIFRKAFHLSGFPRGTAYFPGPEEICKIGGICRQDHRLFFPPVNEILQVGGISPKTSPSGQRKKGFPDPKLWNKSCIIFRDQRHEMTLPDEGHHPPKPVPLKKRGKEQPTMGPESSCFERSPAGAGE